MRAEPSKALSKKALPVWRIQAFLECLLLALIPIGYSALIYFFEFPIWILWVMIGLIFLYFIAKTFIIIPIRWKHWRYEVYTHEVDLKRGVFVVKRTLIPMTRVQHVDTEQGPLLRKYGLAIVTISTAATVHKIPSLSLNVADELRDRIAELAAVAEDE